MKINIGNIKNGDKGIYCGRAYGKYPASPLGNPFKPKNDSDEERHRVCMQYDIWFVKNTKWEDFDEAQGNPIFEELNKIYKELKTNGEVTLLCWCAPKLCHCVTIKEYIGTCVVTEGLHSGNRYKELEKDLGLNIPD